MSCSEPEKPENYGKTTSQLYLGTMPNQPLVVGLGGSEGGNAWSSDYWQSTREKFLEEGYAFLAIGYFGSPGTPDQLDRISIDAVYNTILEAAQDSLIDSKRIAVIGGSKGAELALLMASNFPAIKCVVGIVPCHAAFPALTIMASTSSWMLHDREVPYIPMPWAAVPSALSGDLRGAFEIMLENTEAVEKSRIAVERINGPIMLISARNDEMWPSTEMSEEIVKSLKRSRFPFAYEHVAIEGNHAAPLEHFDSIFSFLNQHFKNME